MPVNPLLGVFYAAGSVAIGAVVSLSFLMTRRVRDPGCVLRRTAWPAIFLPGYMLAANLAKYAGLHLYVDFSCWLQILQNIVVTGRPLCFIEELLVPGHLNYFSSHFVPLVYLLAAPFRFWPYAPTLIVMNFLLLASSVVPLYKLAKINRKDRTWCLWTVVLFLWYPTFQYIVLYEFEMLRFSIPIIFWMLYFWEKRKTALYFLFACLAVLVREEVGLTIMMFGIYLFFIEKSRLKGAITAGIGMAAFVAITQFIMPMFSSQKEFSHIAAGSFSAFGSSPGEILLHVFTRPRTLWAAVMHPVKLANIFMLFLPLGLIPWAAPAVLLSTLANFGVVLISRTLTHSSYMLYYVSPSIPFIFYAFLKAWPRIIRFTAQGKAGTRHEQAVMLAVLAGLFVTNVFFGPSPVSLQFWFKNIRPAPFRTQDFHHSVYRVTEHQRRAEEFVRLIPDTAVVSTQQFLFPRLFKKKGCLIFPALAGRDGTTRADYVFFDKTNNGLSPRSPAFIPAKFFTEIENEKDTWMLIKAEDGYYLYKGLPVPSFYAGSGRLLTDKKGHDADTPDRSPL